MTEAPGLVGGGPLGEIPYLRPLDAAALFRRRAERLRMLAAGHVLGDYLELCGRIAAAQGGALARMRISANGRDLPASRPLDVFSPRSGEWREALAVIARELETAPMPDAAREGLERLARLGVESLEALAGRILAGDFGGIDLAAAPFAAAALQVQFAALASGIPPESVARAESGCPLCGSPPVAGVVLGDDKLRYLACSLCGSQWHHVRVKCSHCFSTAGLSYFSLEGDPGGVKAEACDRCGGYLKLFYLEKRPAAEPLADDLATLPLDLLVSERGYGKSGANLLLLPGAAAIP